MKRSARGPVLLALVLGAAALGVLGTVALPPSIVGRVGRPAGLVTAALLSISLVLLHRLRRDPPQLVLGPALVAIAYALIEATGGLGSSPLYPVVFVAFAMIAGLMRGRVAIVSGVVAILTEVGSHVASAGASLGLAALLAHLGFMAVFSALFATLLMREVRAVREKREEAVKQALDQVTQDARDFRLIASSLGPESRTRRKPEESAQVRQVGSVQAIRDALLDVLEVARIGAGAENAMIFTLDDSGTKLKLKECVTAVAEPSIIDRPIIATEGALGAVVKTKRPLNLTPRTGKQLGYRTRDDVGSFLGVPLLDGGHVAGVLAVDRTSKEPFSARDEDLIAAVAKEVLRAVESERIFAAMDRVKYEQERFHEAFSLLNEALTVDLFAERFLEAVYRIKPVDFIATTMFDGATDTHTIVGLRSGSGGTHDKLKGGTFQNKDGGLVVMALKNGHTLPFIPLSQQPDRSKLQLFGKLPTPVLDSVKVFPLSGRDGPLGALIVGSTQRAMDLTREEERMLETVTAHGAITLSNAQMYKRMEMMATTDGLTGLVNHRRFRELLSEALNRARRFSRNVSVVMVDADHFKTINDTYGHPAGDVVLRRIAAILQLDARRTDVVARYGGEEFVVVLDETDRGGAKIVAERIRERIENEVIQGDFGRIKVTASMGVCSWPEQAETMDELLERADEALYEAKRKGRNQVALWKGAHCAQPDRRDIRADRSDSSGQSRVQA